MSKKIVVFLDSDKKIYDKLNLHLPCCGGSVLQTQANIPCEATRFFNYSKRPYFSKQKTNTQSLVDDSFAENPKIVVIDPFRLRAKDARNLVSIALEKNADRALIWTNKNYIKENDNSLEIEASLGVLDVGVYDKNELPSFLKVLKEKYSNGCDGCKTCNCSQ